MNDKKDKHQCALMSTSSFMVKIKHVRLYYLFSTTTVGSTSF